MALAYIRSIARTIRHIPAYRNREIMAVGADLFLDDRHRARNRP